MRPPDPQPRAACPTCAHCGGVAAAGAVVCEFCGRPLPQGEPAPAWGHAAAQAAPNTSGLGAWVPPEVGRGFNWGGFLVTGVAWAFAMRMPVWGVVALLTGPVLHVAFGFKGNEWAWQHRPFRSVEEFHRVQRAWAAWGVTLTVASAALALALAALACLALLQTGQALYGADGE